MVAVSVIVTVSVIKKQAARFCSALLWGSRRHRCRQAGPREEVATSNAPTART